MSRTCRLLRHVPGSGGTGGRGTPQQLRPLLRHGAGERHGREAAQCPHRVQERRRRLSAGVLLQRRQMRPVGERRFSHHGAERPPRLRQHRPRQRYQRLGGHLCPGDRRRRARGGFPVHHRRYLLNVHGRADGRMPLSRWTGWIGTWRELGRYLSDIRGIEMARGRLRTRWSDDTDS